MVGSATADHSRECDHRASRAPPADAVVITDGPTGAQPERVAPRAGNARRAGAVARLGWPRLFSWFMALGWWIFFSPLPKTSVHGKSRRRWATSRGTDAGAIRGM